LNALAEAAEGDARPGKVLVQMVYAQKCQQELKYIPWKRILSQSSKALPSEIVPFLDLLADAAGHADPPEQEPSPSPFGDQRLLMLRAVAWALVAQGLHAVGLRGPSLDGEICRQLNALLGAGFSQDQGLHELVAVRNCLHIWAACCRSQICTIRKGSGRCHNLLGNRQKSKARILSRAGGAPCEKGMLCIQEDRQVLLW